MNRHDFDQVVALLKSISAPCEMRHGYCRHCLALEECEELNIRRKIAEFIEAIADVQRERKLTP